MTKVPRDPFSFSRLLNVPRPSGSEKSCHEVPKSQKGGETAMAFSDVTKSNVFDRDYFSNVKNGGNLATFGAVNYIILIIHDTA
ncbi:hypothetical protein [Paracoccus sp. T5]|uniref:hypothetical protein n=1 Tax=Paracoccus sp. T5 TaxID=3402161 RepID=UPI003AEDBC77